MKNFLNLTVVHQFTDEETNDNMKSATQPRPQSLQIRSQDANLCCLIVALFPKLSKVRQPHYYEVLTEPIKQKSLEYTL